MRQPRSEAITPAELQWLTGKPQEGASKFWIHVRGAEKVARCRDLIARHPHLITRGRMAVLEKDMAFWAGVRRRGNGGTAC
jgi:hypothetical protein